MRYPNPKINPTHNVETIQKKAKINNFFEHELLILRDFLSASSPLPIAVLVEATTARIPILSSQQDVCTTTILSSQDALLLADNNNQLSEQHIITAILAVVI